VHANDNLGRTGGTYCDGTITCFHENNVTTGVSEIRQTNIDFRIYPNPTTDELNFSLSNTNKIDIKIEIVDVLGQRIKLINYKQVSQSFHDQISMNDISEGVYFIKAYYDSKITTCKFIKQ
jgi:hypothetical protein